MIDSWKFAHLLFMYNEQYNDCTIQCTMVLRKCVWEVLFM